MDENQVKEIVQQMLEEHSAVFWKEIFVALMQSPVLIALLLLITLILFRKSLFNFLTSKKIEFSWGDNKIHLSELSNNIDQELDPIKADLDALKQTLDKLQPTETDQQDAPSILEASGDEAYLKKRINKALSSTKWRWRSLESIAKFARSSPDTILELLYSDPNIQVTKSKDGQTTLAKFKNR